MSWIGDMSFAHDTITGEVLARLGAAGVIGYLSDFPEKNLTAENLADLLAHGLQVGLVFEDQPTDALAGPAVGTEHGRLARAQAQRIGYDLDNCVIFVADDMNTTSDLWPGMLAYLDAFAAQVPHPGYYGDQDSIDWLAPKRPDWWYWQTNATGWGAGTTGNAHLLQRYRDSRAGGLELDVNDIQRQGVPFMGDDMFTDTDRATLNGVASQLIAPSGFLARLGVNLQKTQDRIVLAEHQDVATQLIALQQALASTSGPTNGTDNPHALADDIAAEFARRLGITPPA